MMITEKSYRVIDTALKQSTKMYMIPFTWDGAQFKLVPVTDLTTLRRLFWPATVWAYTAFLLVSKFVRAETLARDQVKNVMHTIFLIAYSCISVIVLNTVKNREHLASLFNQYFRFIKKLDATGHVNDHLDISYILVKSFIFMSYSQSFFAMLMYLEAPGSTYYFYSAVPGAGRSLPLSVVFGVLECAYYICVWQYCIFIFIVIFPYFYGTLYWLQEITCQVNRPKPFSLECTYANYKCFQIFAQEFNCCFAQIFFPFIQFYVILLPVVSNNIVLSHYHELSPAACAMLVGVCVSSIVNLFIIFPKAAAVNSLSIHFIKTLGAKAQERAQDQVEMHPTPSGGRTSKRWKPRARNFKLPINKKQVRACFPIKIRINSFAYIVRFTTLKIVGLIFYWTVRSILLTRK